MVCRFDKLRIEQSPYVRSLILWWWGFGVVNIIGIDPKEAHVEEIWLSRSTTMGFIPMHKSKSRFMMELESGATLHNFNANFLLAFLFLVLSRRRKCQGWDTSRYQGYPLLPITLFIFPYLELTIYFN